MMEKPSIKTFGDRIKQARLAKGYSFKKLSELSTVSAGVLSKYEKWENIVPREKTLKQICNALDVSTDYILSGDNNKKSLSEMSFSDLKALFDFLQMRREIIEETKEDFNGGEIEELKNFQNKIWLELYIRSNDIFKEGIENSDKI